MAGGISVDGTQRLPGPARHGEWQPKPEDGKGDSKGALRPQFERKQRTSRHEEDARESENGENLNS